MQPEKHPGADQKLNINSEEVTTTNTLLSRISPEKPPINSGRLHDEHDGEKAARPDFITPNSNDRGRRRSSPRPGAQFPTNEMSDRSKWLNFEQFAAIPRKDLIKTKICELWRDGPSVPFFWRSS
jgi:hypothetical protein